MQYRKVDVFKDDNRIEIIFRGMRVVQVGIRSDGTPIVSIPNEDEVELDQDLGIDLVPFDADVVVRRPSPEWTIQQEYVPTFDRTAIEDVEETLTFQRVRNTNRNETVSDDHLLSTEVRNALNAILDSYIDEPVQSRARTAAITRDIAERFEYPKYAIAGVRAALTKGIYGDFDDLVSARRRHRVVRVQIVEES